MSRSTCLIRHVLTALLLLAGCTAPPRPVPDLPAPTPAPPVQVRVGTTVPGFGALELDAAVTRPLEAALAGVPDVTELYARTGPDRVDIVATLKSPAAIDAVRAAVTGALPRLPEAVEHPVLTRIDGVQPALTLAVPPEFAGTVGDTLEQITGVARVEVCGARERRLIVGLDPERLDRAPVDQVITAVEAALADPDPAPAIEHLSSRPVAGALQLRDLAVVQDGLLPATCHAYGARGPVVLLTVLTQSGADPAEVAAAARARAVELVSPTVDFFADPVPPADAPELAVLALELARTDSVGSDLAACLARAPGLPAWALTVPVDAVPDPAVARARMFLAGVPAAPLQPVLKNLSQCTGIQRVAVLAPRAAADHGLSVRVLGPEVLDLLTTARRLSAQFAGLPGVTALDLVAVHAPQTRTIELDRDRLAARGVPAAVAARAVGLALAPLTVRGPAGELVDIDLTDRTGPIDQLLTRVRLGSPSGPVALAELARVADHELPPLHRIDQTPAIVVELRLRRAADREDVERVVARDVELPAGLRVELGPALPALDP